MLNKENPEVYRDVIKLHMYLKSNHKQKEDIFFVYTDQFNVLFNIFLLFYMVFVSKWMKINQERYA